MVTLTGTKTALATPVTRETVNTILETDNVQATVEVSTGTTDAVIGVEVEVEVEVAIDSETMIETGIGMIGVGMIGITYRPKGRDHPSSLLGR